MAVGLGGRGLTPAKHEPQCQLYNWVIGCWSASCSLNMDLLEVGLGALAGARLLQGCREVQVESRPPSQLELGCSSSSVL